MFVLGSQSIIDIPPCGDETSYIVDILVIHHLHCLITKVEDFKDMVPVIQTVFPNEFVAFPPSNLLVSPSSWGIISLRFSHHLIFPSWQRFVLIYQSFHGRMDSE